MSSTLTIEPLAVDKETAAAMLGGISTSTLETLGRTEPLLQPVELSTRRVGYPVENLKAWLRTRQKSNQLPPENCGIGRKGKRASNAKVSGAGTASAGLPGSASGNYGER